jgi:DNA-binding winged helix-turn-helix (wHTH) protein
MWNGELSGLLKPGNAGIPREESLVKLSSKQSCCLHCLGLYATLLSKGHFIKVWSTSVPTWDGFYQGNKKK